MKNMYCFKASTLRIMENKENTRLILKETMTPPNKLVAFVWFFTLICVLSWSCHFHTT